MLDPGPGGSQPGARGDHRIACAAALLTVVAFFLPLLGRGEVLLGEGISDEISARIAKVNDSERTRAFRDQLVAFLPELEQQLHGPRSGWLATWNPTVEQGRPPWHLSGFTRAFVLTNVLSWWIDDAFWLYTALAICAVLACAGFGYGLLHSLELGPAACYLGAVGLALGVYVSFWLTFALYVWGVAWCVALLWLAPRLLRRGGAGAGVALAFCVHGLLMTSYPQQTVWSGWLIVLVLARALAAMPGGSRARLAGLGRLLLYGGLGVASVAPVYLDLLHAAAAAGRDHLPFEYFREPLPDLAGVADWGAFLARTYDASWFGNAVDHGYPFRIKGVSLTPLFAGLFAVSFVLRRGRELWPWQLFLGATLLVTVAPPVYRFGVEHLGLGLSRHAPLAGAHVPLMVLGAIAADRVLRAGARSRAVLVGAALVPAVVALVGLALSGQAPDARGLALSGVGLAGTVFFLLRPRGWQLVGLAWFTVAVASSPLVLAVPRAQALEEQEFAADVRARCEPGERYLWIADRFRYLLRPNQEILFGLKSVHTYNTLCSRRYREWAARVSASGFEEQGKQFRRLDSADRLDAETLALAGVGLVISGIALDQPFVRETGKLRLLTFYEPELPPLAEARFDAFELRDGEAAVAPAAVRAAALATGGERTAVRTADAGDRIEIEVGPAPQRSLLFVGQQYHADWRARAGDEPLECVAVDGLYQGVLLPPGCERVTLEFRPWARWSWLPQVLFALAGLVLAGRVVLGRRLSAS